MSPAAAGLTSGDLPAGTAGTPLRTLPGDQAQPGDKAGDKAGDNPRSLSPVPAQYAAVQLPRVINWTARELMAQTFAEPRWAVKGLIPEGVTMLAGAPKMGKSWIALGLHVAVSSGGKAFGAIDVEPGPSLYLALEDTGRRLQRRLGQVLQGADPPRGLVLAIECPPLPSGGLALIEKWLERESEPRLISIDVFERVRGPMLPGQSAYTADYAAVRQIKQLADAYSVAVVLVHHLRKQGNGGNDYLSEISGTLGLPGACDTIAILRRSRGEADGLLQITGRDVEEEEYALRFDPKLGAWQMLGRAAELDIADTRRKILDWLRGHPGDKPAAIAIGTALGRDLVKKTAARMADAGQLDTDHQGRYFPPQPVIDLPEE